MTKDKNRSIGFEIWFFLLYNKQMLDCSAGISTMGRDFKWLHCVSTEADVVITMSWWFCERWLPTENSSVKLSATESVWSSKICRMICPNSVVSGSVIKFCPCKSFKESAVFSARGCCLLTNAEISCWETGRAQMESVSLALGKNPKRSVSQSVSNLLYGRKIVDLKCDLCGVLFLVGENQIRNKIQQQRGRRS